MDDQNKDTLTFLAACYVLTQDRISARACFAELKQLDPDIRTAEVEKSHSYFADDTLKLMIDSIGSLMTDEQSDNRLRVVKT